MTPCVLWHGRVAPDGYGTLSGKLAHRVEYEREVGSIPVGMTLDHVCHSTDVNCIGGPHCMHRRCVNVEHLEPVSMAENTRRGRGFTPLNAAKTHCPSGHTYDEANTYRSKLGRHCRACNREAARRYKARQSALTAVGGAR